MSRTSAITREKVLENISTAAGYDMDRTRKHVESLLRNEFLPHAGISDAKKVVKRKLIFLGAMVRRLSSVLAHETEPDDRGVLLRFFD